MMTLKQAKMESWPAYQPVVYLCIHQVTSNKAIDHIKLCRLDYLGP